MGTEIPPREVLKRDEPHQTGSFFQQVGGNLKFNPFLPEVREDPYPFYEHLRREDPVHRSFIGGDWLLTRYADIQSVLLDKRFRANDKAKQIQWKNQYTSQIGEDLSTLIQANNSFLFYMDPPDHTRLRGLVRKAFTPAVVEHMRPRMQEFVDTLIGKVQHTGSMDIISDLASPLPVMVIAELLGVPSEDQFKLKQWGNDLICILDPLLSLEQLANLNETTKEFEEYFRTLIAQRERMPKNDLISALIMSSDEDNKLMKDEVWAVCMLLFVTGEETTVNTIGNGMLALLRHPEKMNHLKQNPLLIQSAVEELLRFDSPVQLTSRIAIENIELAGKTILAGEKVSLCLGAANRDPMEFLDPDTLNLARMNNHHLAFGEGIHFCLGANLARAQSQLAINTLIQKFPEMNMLPGKLERRENIVLRGLKSLPVTFKK